jgi:inorganic triphosphatase YgiF
MAQPLGTPTRQCPIISSHTECELKLAVSSDFHLPRLPGTPLPRRYLISTYYDQAAYDLAQPVLNGA